MTSRAAGADPGHAGVFQTIRETPLTARIVLLAIFINALGAFLQFFLVLYLTVRGFSIAQAGLALGFYSIGSIVGTFVGGTMADLLGSRWTIVICMGSAALFTLSVTFLHSLAAILVVVPLSAAMTRASGTASSALLFGLTPKARQVMMSAMFRTALNSGVAIGPLIATVLSTISWNLVFWCDAATSLTYCVIAAFLLPAGRLAKETAAAARAPAQKKAAPAGGRPGYGTILRDRKYLVFLGLMLANGLVHVQFYAVLPLMLRAAGYATWAYSSVAAAAAALVVVAQLRVTRTTQSWPTRVATMTGWVMLVVGRGGFGLPGGLAVIVISELISTTGELIGGPAAFTHPVHVAPPGATARYIGSANAMFSLGYAIGPLAGVLLWSHIGNSFWALIVALGAVMTGPGIWSMRTASGPAAAPDEGGQPGQPAGDVAAGAATTTESAN